MTYRYQLYKCPICGTVTEIVHDGVSAMICCGKTMEVLDDREPVGTKESHMPVVEATEKGCKVTTPCCASTSRPGRLRSLNSPFPLIRSCSPAPTVTSTALGVRNSPAVL